MTYKIESGRRFGGVENRKLAQERSVRNQNHCAKRMLFAANFVSERIPLYIFLFRSALHAQRECRTGSDPDPLGWLPIFSS